MSTYCDYAIGHEWHGPYHDNEYGFPIHDDNRLFERLVLEINQAGLSWLTILKKKAAFVKAFDGFDIDIVAAYNSADVARLLADKDIIRNRLKINATIENARRIQALRPNFGSFKGWLDHHHSNGAHNIELWVKLFKKTFVFTGGEICNEFLMSTGYLPGAHAPNCPVYKKVVAHNPAWLRGIDKSN
jgi:DNA-3-methyladenine glycosylase I